MIKMFIRHTVADFAKWKATYDQNDALRKQFGCIKAEVFTNTQNPNDVLAVHYWEDLERAAEFIQSPILKEAMAHAGVTSTPEFSFAD
jgi:quinol monooxygenase YgiN